MTLKKTTAGILLAAFAAIASAKAPAEDATTTAPTNGATNAVSTNSFYATKYVNSVHLAYIRSPSSSTNSASKEGLTNLANALTERTSVEPSGVVELNIERDELSFFPFIYWPVTKNAPPLSDNAQEKVQSYINTGGVILFDVQDQTTKLGKSKILRNMLGDVNIKPLAPMNEEHTLTKAFYLVSSLPGSNNYGTVWVESEDAEQDDISSVIIGNKNWAGAWAGKTVAPKSQEEEMAIRSGINMVMFSLSGNYKADQIHIPSILERLNN